jgi:WD40 repeat protein
MILDQVDAHKPIIKDLDFNLDVPFLASTSNDNGCRIWDLAKGTYVTSLVATSL